MRMSQDELNQFVDFLRENCRVQQITSYFPQPNEHGEYFRAVCEGHLLIAHLLEAGQLCVLTDDRYQLVLWNRWTEYRKTHLRPASIQAKLKSLLTSGRRLEPVAPVLHQADVNAVTLDLPRK